MLLSTITFAMRFILSSYKALGPVTQVLEYILPQYRNTATKAVMGKINFNTRHLKKGDPLPPGNGKLRVYNMRYCPYAQRTLLALIAKKIDFEVVNVNLVEKPEWLTSKSAFAKVPALEVEENLSIYESLITVEYLDDVYPQRPLFSKDPVKKAFDKIIVEASGPIHTLLFRTLTMPDTITKETINAYVTALGFIQEQLKKRGTTYLGGEEPGYSDYMIWPWFERILALEETHDNFKIDAEKFKLLRKYIDDMLQDPVVVEYLIPKDVMVKFIESYKVKTPLYDMLAEE